MLLHTYSYPWSCSTKVQAVVELIQRLRAEDDTNQVVIFSQWQKVGEELGETEAALE